MSIQDATTLLNEDTGLFAFLPVVNYVFVIIQNLTDQLLILAILATLISALIYSVITGGPGNLTEIQRWVLVIVAAGWLILLFISMTLLWGYFSKPWFMPEILFFASVSFLALLVTDGLLRLFLEGYDSQL